METTKRILFPVDLSEVSPKIVPEVIKMAGKLDAEIHLLFVTGTLEEYDTFYVPHPSLDGFEAELHRTGERRLIEFQQDYFGDYPYIRRAVLTGNPAEEILKYIKLAEIDMVIMGTHGRKGLDRMIFGSVAEQVVKESSVPVMSINPYFVKGEPRIMLGAMSPELFGYARADCLNCSGSVSNCVDTCAM